MKSGLVRTHAQACSNRGVQSKWIPPREHTGEEAGKGSIPPTVMRRVARHMMCKLDSTAIDARAGC